MSMQTERTFYKTTFQIEVLSEHPLGDVDAFYGLEDLHYMITDGNCVGRVEFTGECELNGKGMADALYDLASEPGFFMLTDDGEDSDDFDGGDE